MATKYRYVEEGRAVYLEYKRWFFWCRERKTHSPSSAFAGPITTDKNYHTVEAARQEIDRRLAEEARWAARVTEYPVS
jgi:hypothetical protein